MTFTVTVQRPRWREHQDTVWAALTRACGTPPVPVIKGNGYGLGQRLLTDEAVRLDADIVAVGTVWEIDSVAESGSHDIVVLQPFEPGDDVAAVEWWRLGSRLHAGRVIRTVASPQALVALAAGPGSVRVVLEVRTSMQRFGMTERELLELLADSRVRRGLELAHILIEGVSLHLPLVQPAHPRAARGATGTAKVREVLRWAALWHAQTEVWPGHNSPASRLWASHLNDDEAALVHAAQPDVDLRLRTGTRLWLGDRGALQAHGTVLEVHAVKENTAVGYRQQTGPSDGTLVVVGGGTSHGIGLSAPSIPATLRQRTVAAGTGLLESVGRAMSPFSWEGRQRWFAEPPHQQVSLVWLPWGCVVPAVGQLMPADVRYTTSRFDAVLVTD